MNIIGGNDNGPGCGFLSSREVDALIEGRLGARRAGLFDAHRDRGCGECLHLHAAAESFREILEHGVLEAEQTAFARIRRSVEVRLGQEVDRLQDGSGRSLFGRPWGVGRGLSADELEQIAAAGQSDLDEPVTDEDDPAEPEQE